MSDAVAVVLLLAVVDVRDLRRRRLRRRLLGPDRGRRRPRRAAARGDRALDRPGVGGQPCLADLRLRRPVDLLSRGVRLDHPDPLRAADHRGSGHRAARREFRVPQSGRQLDTAARSARIRRLVGAGALLLGRRRGRHRLRPGAGRRPGRRSGGQLGQPDLDRRRRPGCAVVAYLAAVYLVWDARRIDDGGWSTTSAGEPSGRRVVAILGLVGIFILRADAPYLFQGLADPGVAAGYPQRFVRGGRLVLLTRSAHRGARVLAIIAVACAILAWGAAQWPYILPESLTFSAAAAQPAPSLPC